MKEEDLTGRKFGKLTVICKAQDKFDKNGYRRKMWTCICSCENNTIVDVREDSLKSKHTTSCGCSRKNNGGKATHGMTGTRIHNIWRGIKGRCYNPNNIIFKYYGGRGIKMCDEWKNDFNTFYAWAIDNGYNDELTIERIDVNGNYEPSNCCWENMKKQANNKRNNHYITYNGETHTIAEWSEITGIPYNTIENRINRMNWTIERSLTELV